MLYAFTGTRTLNEQQIRQIDQIQKTYPIEEVYVGDADGVDEMVRDYFYYCKVAIFHVDGYEKKDFAIRSMRMIDQLAANGGVLLAFPNKPCPPKTTPKTPFNGGGSGTWGTIAYARAKGVEVEVFMSGTAQWPTWYHQPIPGAGCVQLSLF